MLTKIFSLSKWRVKAESSDSFQKPKTVVTEREINDYLSQENGMIRLKRAFDTSNGNLSPELQYYFDNYFNKSSAQIIFVLSSLFVFRRNSQLFQQNMQRMKLFQTLFKESVSCSVKNFTVFVLSFGIIETISVYRNKTSPWEFGFVGGLMGLFNGIKYNVKPIQPPKNLANKAPLKPVTRLVAIRNCTLSGTVMGLVIGALLTYVVGDVSQEKRHFWNVHDKLQKEKEKEFGLPKAVDMENDGWY